MLVLSSCSSRRLLAFSSCSCCSCRILLLASCSSRCSSRIFCSCSWCSSTAFSADRSSEISFYSRRQSHCPCLTSEWAERTTTQRQAERQGRRAQCSYKPCQCSEIYVKQWLFLSSLARRIDYISLGWIKGWIKSSWTLLNEFSLKLLK